MAILLTGAFYGASFVYNLWFSAVQALGGLPDGGTNTTQGQAQGGSKLKVRASSQEGSVRAKGAPPAAGLFEGQASCVS